MTHSKGWISQTMTGSDSKVQSSQLALKGNMSAGDAAHSVDMLSSSACQVQRTQDAMRGLVQHLAGSQAGLLHIDRREEALEERCCERHLLPRICEVAEHHLQAHHSI